MCCCGLGVIILLVLTIFRAATFALLEPYLAPEINYTQFSQTEIDNLDFGTDFDFGSATAAYQVEKSVGPSNWGKFEREGKAPPHLNACEAIEHFDEDLEIMKKAGLKRYRLGVSWSGIERSRHQYNDTYLQNYVIQCDKLRAVGIEPMITLFHFEYPEYVDDDGGLLSPTFITDFLAFAEHVLRVLNGHCKYFFTINEPLSYGLLGYLGGTFPPGKVAAFSKFFKVNGVMMEQHARAYKLIHQIVPDAQVSLTNQIIPLIPKHKWSLLETIIAAAANQFINFPYMECLNTGILEWKILGIRFYRKVIPGLKNSVDFLGMNHYTCVFATIDPRDWNEFPLANRRPNKDIPLSDFDWSCIPDSVAMVMRWTDRIWNPRHLKIVISEHGVSDAKDKVRPWFIMQSMGHIKRTIDEGVPIIAYLEWSLLDNYEWHDGYTQHFGFVKVNLVNQTRTPQPSFEQFAKLARKSK